MSISEKAVGLPADLSFSMYEASGLAAYGLQFDQVRAAYRGIVATAALPLHEGGSAYEQCAAIADERAKHVSTANARSACEGVAAAIRAAAPVECKQEAGAVQRAYKAAAFQWDLAAQDHNEALRRWVAGNGEGDKPAAPEPLSKNRDDYIIGALIAEDHQK